MISKIAFKRFFLFPFLGALVAIVGFGASFNTAGAATKYLPLNSVQQAAVNGVQYSDMMSIRQQNGRTHLPEVACLDNAAKVWATAMATSGFHHSDPTTLDQAACPGSNFRGHGENIGEVVPCTSTDAWIIGNACSQPMFNSFFLSPEHRANMLDPVNPNTGQRIVWTGVGVGCYEAPNGTLFIVHEFAQNW